ncbi:Hypothetical predicted protein [Octopus vulgaris]|uniref:Uncharacterized protein n=2 Tax=Octopus TaxID=6643 RepID=A0AA36B4D8_OCTVU|nr:enkurin-like [Octopus sinensis]CAI9727695.1 Hypothetical predicted protein [Octopus vulgaris]
MPVAVKKLPDKEYITNLIPAEHIPEPKPPRYISKYRPQVKVEKKRTQEIAKTMGPAKVEIPDTKNFLRKNSKKAVNVKPAAAEKSSQDRTTCTTKKPSLPSKDNVPMCGMKTTKNFITENAIEIITSLPKKVTQKYCDTRNGDKHLLLPSGIKPLFIQKKDYGQIPAYLKKRREDVKMLHGRYEAAVKKQIEDNTMKQLSEEEREELLSGLKKNWEAVHHDFQGLSVVIDTIRKKHLKEKLEMLMKQLEQDIALIEKHKRIYLGNDPDGCQY